MTNVFVDDEQKAHAFYTDVLGFETRAHIDLGEALFVTVGAPGQDVELLLEPGDSPVARAYTKGLREAGLPCIVFAVDDLRAEYERLRALGSPSRRSPSSRAPC